MIFAPIADLGWVTIVFIFGLGILVFTVPVTILLEAMIIGFAFKLSFKRSLTDSFLMNLGSGILGIMAVISFGESIFSGLDTPRSHYYGPEPGAAVITFARMMGIPCVISIIVEGFFLWFLESRYSPWQTIWLTSVLSNLLSYLGMFAILMLLSS